MPGKNFLKQLDKNQRLLCNFNSESRKDGNHIQEEYFDTIMKLDDLNIPTMYKKECMRKVRRIFENILNSRAFYKPHYLVQKQFSKVIYNDSLEDDLRKELKKLMENAEKMSV